MTALTIEEEVCFKTRWELAHNSSSGARRSQSHFILMICRTAWTETSSSANVSGHSFSVASFQACESSNNGLLIRLRRHCRHERGDFPATKHQITGILQGKLRRYLVLFKTGTVQHKRTFNI